MKSTLLICISILCIYGCTHKYNTPPPADGKFLLHLHSNIDTNEVEGYDSVYMDADGRKVSLKLAQFYISSVKLYKPDGSFYLIPDGYVLKKLDPEMYIVGDAPAGDYTSFSFEVGVDSVTNNKLPSSFPTSSPLSTQSPSMWFGDVTKGYIFMNVSGKVDTSDTHTGNANMPFSFQIGSNTLRKKVVMPQQSFKVIPNQRYEAHVTCDYGILLRGIDFKVDNVTDTYTMNPALAMQVANNIPLMFRYE